MIILMSKKFKAIYMPDEEGKEHYTKEGFANEEEAEKYIIDHFCDACNQHEEPDRSSCRAEWFIEVYEE